MKKVETTVNDDFWNAYRDRVKNVMIPYQWRVLNDEVDIASSGASSYQAREKSHAIENLRIAAGRATGHFHGMWFQDSDVYKWLEAAAYVLAMGPDATLQHEVETTVALIAGAQQPDGYLDTYFQLEAPARKLKHIAKSHELYCMGHYIEAGVAVYQVLHNQQALAVATKMADFIAAHFGPEPGKLHGYPGHPEVELALAKLAEVTGNDRYLNLAAYMIDARGTTPNFFASQHAADATTDSYWPGPEPALRYLQADVPVRDMKTAEGHAVRMGYLLTGMAQVARQRHDAGLAAACQRLFMDIVAKQMYVTGGVGATANGEAFTFDYDLPNDTAYAETCASCAMVFFADQLQQIRPERTYADVIERELFNGTISGMALDGQHFFYVNPLAVDPQASAMDPNKQHVLPTRPAWLACACCPPNLARLIGELPRYIYTVHDDTVYVDQFIGSTLTLDHGVTITQTGHYPWAGDITLTLRADQPTRVKVAVRRPAWAPDAQLMTAAGQPVTATTPGGYFLLDGPVQGEVQYRLHLPLTPRRVYADPAVKADIALVALARGPVVYCLEQVDNGPKLPWRVLAKGASITAQMDLTRLTIPVVTLTAPGCQLPTTRGAQTSETTLTFVPYFAWANRAVGEMTVFVREG